MIRRGLSSVSDARNVKILLRRVYLKVHPDLFGKYPDKQSVNQASMQELQSLYDELVSGRNLSLRKARTIVFHVRDETSTTSSREMKDPENFREVTLSFSGVNGFLRSLDELVGGECSTSSGPSRKNYSAHPNSRPASTNIMDFLSGSEGAAHRSRTIVSLRSSKDKLQEHSIDEVEVLVAHLKRRLGLHLEIHDKVKPDSRSQLARKAAALIDTLELAEGEGVSSGKIVINDGFDVGIQRNSTGSGYLNLGACASESLWRSHLNSQAFRMICKGNRIARQTLDRAESTAAQALGLRFVLTDQTAVSERYDQYNRLLAGITCRGAILPSRSAELSCLSLMILLERNEFGSDIENGVVSVPLSASVDAILEHVQDIGKDVASLHREFLRQQEYEHYVRGLVMRSTRSFLAGFRLLEPETTAELAVPGDLLERMPK
ncbi:hypothetical protein NDN08_007786 [Rhodosorus marinus]|uniref:DUF4460 domain-containing protein n=1 Tax=Rhodosorus marinus TaxID=101924 RepID=A0AAV8UYW0_9RHOD|nr:hypothetical protein NDN08_007786 [Rhodosorus marinus]